jgi:nucleotide-binding universal stress UspA family protein
MTSILVPTDFSNTAAKSAIYAAEIARKNDAVLCLLHATELGREYIHQPFPLHDKYNELVKDDRLDKLLALAKSVNDVYANVKVEIALILTNTVQGIIEFCNKHAFDLIVMGTSGSSGIKEVIIGSVTANVIAKSSVPVLAIPDKYVMEEPDAILFATSNYEREISLLEKLIAIARLFSASVHVVVFENIHSSRPNVHTNNTQVQQYLEFLKNAFQDISFKGELVQGTSFEGAIELYSIANGVDIIGMITYPKGLLARMLHQSTTQKMTFHSHIPILAIPAGKM